MKIHFFISKLGNGGAERVVSLLANELDDRGHDITVFCFRPTNEYAVNHSVKRIRFHKKRIINSVVFNGFFSMLRHYWNPKNRPDVMSTHINTLGFMTIPIAKIYGIKIIASEHINHSVNPTRAKRFLHKFLFPKVDVLTVLTKYDLPYYQELGANAKVVYNPFTFSTPGSVEHPKPEYKTIIAVGDLNRYHQKGFDNLVQIAKEVAIQHPDWKFKIVGGGENGRKHLEALAQEFQIEKNIEFTGFQSDVKSLLNKADIFILPSRYEGLPMSLLEGMSQNMACIAYDCVSGPSEIITDKKNGILVSDQDQAEMIAKLKELITDSDWRNQLAQAASSALNPFDIKTVGDLWVSLFKSITKIEEEHRN